jgi:lipopolysaccharide transport system ATP-binding protein
MKEVTSRGRTVLFVSHNMAAVTSLCSSGILLSGGQIAFAGAIETAISEYGRSAEVCYSISIPSTDSKASICAIKVDREALAAGHLVVDIVFAAPKPLSIAIGGVVLRALSGEAIWGSNNQFHDHGSETRGLARGTLRCVARNLPIVPGQYLLSVWLSDWHEPLDSKIDILRVDFGLESTHPLRPPPAAIGYMDWPARWSNPSGDPFLKG